MTKKRIAIVGATGYTGSELVRILKHHPEVEISLITSESRAGEQFSDVHPFFRGIADDVLHSVEKLEETDVDAAFLALPHGVSMEYVKRFAGKGFKMIDLSGDFRLNSPAIYSEWYKKEHTYPQGFEQAAYGLPEFFSEEIKTAVLVANPGCYPTSAALALTPLFQEGLVENKVIVDSKSGVTGAGVKASATTHFSNVNDNFKAYGLKSHRHTVEIENTLLNASGEEAIVQFTPHLLPVDRGILTTAYAQPKGQISAKEIKELYQEYYSDKPFVRLCASAPAIKEVRGSNYCNLYTDFDERTGNVLLVSVIDNLVKGAAGQAVQNMNLMFGFEETLGLQQIPLNP